jgi:hypothetical protein
MSDTLHDPPHLRSVLILNAAVQHFDSPAVGSIGRVAPPHLADLPVEPGR